MMHRCGRAVAGVLLGLAVATGAAGSPGADADADAKQKAKEAYDAFVQAYLKSDWGAIREADKAASRLLGHMTPEQRADLVYVRKTAPEYRPAWWQLSKSTTQQTIRATIWGRGIQCNFVPANNPAVSATINGPRIQLDVSWNPSFVDSTVPEKTQVAESHGITRGDLGEVIVWAQLGRSYLHAALPPDKLLALFREDRHFYDHLGGLFAELTTMYHCSPQARKTALLLEGSTLFQPGEAPEAQLRACRAVSGLLTALVLTNPKQWPSVKLPFHVADTNIERETASFLCNNLEPAWTLAEDRAFREAVRSFFRENAERAVFQRGRLLLPNKMTFVLLEPDDRPFQAKRDEWAKQQLGKALK